MKKHLCLLMTAAILFSFCGVTAFADDILYEPTNTIQEEVTQSDGEPLVDDADTLLMTTDFSPLAANGYTEVKQDTLNSLYSYSNHGKYILMSDIELDNTWGISSNTEVTLDLNGFDVTTKGATSIFTVNGTLTLEDSNKTARYFDTTGNEVSESDSVLTISGGIITGGTSGYGNLGGGGIYINSGGTLNMDGGNVVGNSISTTDRFGGGVYNAGTLNMDGGTIAFNQSTADKGGGVYNKGTFNMTGGAISYNASGKFGGGLYNVSAFDMSGGEISYNTCTNGGAGISNAEGGTIVMSGDASIKGNVASGACGGIFLAEGSVTMSDTASITGNHGSNNGGLGVQQSTSTLTMSDHASITGNTATGVGGGVTVSNGGKFKISGNAQVTGNLSGASKGATTGTDSNIYLATGNTITVTDNYTGTSGITHADGTGLVATGATSQYTVWDSNDATTLNFASDVANLYLVKDGDTTEDLYLKEAIVTEGNDQTATYSASGIDLTERVTYMFDASTSTSDITVTKGTGDGELNTDGATLDVTTVGTFIISTNLQRDAETEAPYITQATLTVEPKAITVTGITTVDRGPDSGSLWVEIDTSSTGTENVSFAEINAGGTTGDALTISDLSIYYDDAYGLIDNDDFDNNLTTTETTFGVTIKNLKLTGDNAANYVLSDNITSTVTINIAIPYISWPTAKEVTWGNARTDNDFYGGKVIVGQTVDGKMTYTELSGSFQWVDTELTAEANAGTYEYDVKFVETTPNENATYYSELSTTTNKITQVVEPAAVTFTITNNTIDLAVGGTPTISAEDENDTPVTEYNLFYYYNCTYEGVTAWQWDWSGGVPTFNEVGTYLVGAELTSDNYHHAGTVVTSAKQIGAIEVYEGDAPATYTVTFSVNGTIDTDLTIDGALSGDVHVLPTLDTEKYSGWSYNGVTYDLGGRFAQPASDVVLTSVAAPDKMTVSGNITGTDLDGTTGKLSGIAVGLWQGSTLVDSLTTDTVSEHSYSFSVVAGKYNLVITRDMGVKCEITKYVDVTSEDYEQDFDLPDVLQNAVLTIEKGLPDIAVQGLTDLVSSFGHTDDDTAEDVDSEVKLDITEDGVDDDGKISNEATAIQAAALSNDNLSSDNVKMFFNIDITAKVGDATTYSDVHELDDCLTFYIPLTGIYQGHKNYYVYRYHDPDGDGTGEVQQLFEEENEDGEYFEIVDDVLIIHARYFSLYAMGFDNTITSSGSSSGGTSIYRPILDADDGGSIGNISISNPTRGNVVKFYVSEDDGYTLDDLTITDSDGNEYEITDLGDGWYSYVQPATVVTISATFDGDDDSDSSGSGDEDADSDDTESVLPFTDVSVDDWFYEDVKYLYESGIMSGTSATTFSPYDGNSRAMVAQLMYNIEGRQERTVIDFFPDVVVGQWHEIGINWCATYSIVDGYDDGLYRPDRIISREEYTSVLYGYSSDRGYDMTNLADLSGYNDAPTSWAKTYVMWAVNEGIVCGTDEGYLNAQDQLTRCEAAAIIARFLRNVYPNI